MRPFSPTLPADGPKWLVLGEHVFEIERDRIETAFAWVRNLTPLELPALDEEPRPSRYRTEGELMAKIKPNPPLISPSLAPPGTLTPPPKPPRPGSK